MAPSMSPADKGHAHAHVATVKPLARRPQLPQLPQLPAITMTDDLDD